MLRLISGLKYTGAYDDIVLDMDLSLDRTMVPVYAMADAIVMVGDCSRDSEMKAERAISALRTLEGNSDNPVENRICRINSGVDRTQVRKNAQERDIVEMLADMDLFDRFL